MRLIECYVENFGKLSAYTHRFSDGLNTVCGENGSGKTTLSFFIKAMFYGLGSERKQSLDDNERKKYLPWQGGRYGGSLTFENNGKVYRIERSFGSKAADDSFSLVLRDTGEISSDYSDNIGFELFDIDAQGFERTLFLSEKNLSGAVVNDTIAAKLSDLVGTTGDVGEISAALSKLEERRKYYHKRGGSGEISALKSKISECDSALTVLERQRLELELTEAKLKELELAIIATDDERETLAKEMAEERAKLSSRTYREQYASMKAAIDADKASLLELSDYFKEGIPDTFEIDAARDAMREAARLNSERRDNESPELTELRDFFARDTDFAEIDRTKSALQRRANAEAERDAIIKNSEFAEGALRDELGGVLPSSSEALAMIPTRKTRLIRAIPFTLTILAAAFFGAYIILSGLPFIILGCVTATLAAASIFLIPKSASSEIKKRLKAALGNAFNPTTLYERILAHEATKARDELTVAELNALMAATEAEVAEFTSRYNHGKETHTEALTFIEEKYKRFFALREIARQNESSRTDLDVRIKYFESKAKSFLDKYPTSGSNPFDEIRSKLNAYNYLQMTLSRRETECRDFMVMHGISESEEIHTETVRDIGEIEQRMNASKAKLLELRREQALIEREYNETLRSVERIDEVNAAREGLCERLIQATESLSIITATSDMLSKASTAITSRYIGGTKERFERYVKMIGGSDSEFAVGTDFVIKKYDRGETRSQESYSRGMRELHAFCLRLALSDSLYGGKIPFIILDDPFISLDNDRLDAAKGLIKEIGKERQVIYFTCSAERTIR